MIVAVSGFRAHIRRVRLSQTLHVAPAICPGNKLNCKLRHQQDRLCLWPICLLRLRRRALGQCRLQNMGQFLPALLCSAEYPRTRPAAQTIPLQVVASRLQNVRQQTRDGVAVPLLHAERPRFATRPNTRTFPFRRGRQRSRPLCRLKASRGRFRIRSNGAVAADKFGE